MTKPYKNLSKNELKIELNKLEKEFKEYESLNLNISMARGKP